MLCSLGVGELVTGIYSGLLAWSFIAARSARYWLSVGCSVEDGTGMGQQNVVDLLCGLQ